MINIYDIFTSLIAFIILLTVFITQVIIIKKRREVIKNAKNKWETRNK